jgi:DNA-binding transcriptional regulator YiaG
MSKMRAQIVALEKQVASLQKGAKAASQATAAPEKPSKAVRLLKGATIRTMRARLDITASQLARLVGVTDQSVYNWEHEKARPKAAQAAALVELKALGKREVRERLVNRA